MILNMIFLAVIYMIEPYMWLKSMSTLGWKNERIRRYSWIFFLGYYILTLAKQYAAFSGVGGAWGTLFSVLMNLSVIAVLFTLKGSVLKKTYAIGLFLICIYITEMITFLFIVVILQVPVSVFFEFGFMNTLCTLITKVLLIPINYVFFLKKEKSIINLLYGNKELLPLIILTIAFEIITLTIFPYSELKEISIQTMMIIVLSQVILLATMFYITAILKKVKAELEQKKKIIELTNSLDNLRHDMSSHVRVLKSYARDGKFDELTEYMNKTFADVDAAKEVCTLNNYAVSALLSSFIEEFEKKKIEFSRIISVKDFIISDSEICSVLSNILKNAMEAVEKVKGEERFICLEITPQGKGYYINCINSCEAAPKCENGNLQTTKSDKMSHGRGINIIKSIVEKKGRGKVTTNIEDDFFEINCKFNGMER